MRIRVRHSSSTIRRQLQHLHRCKWRTVRMTKIKVNVVPTTLNGFAKSDHAVLLLCAACALCSNVELHPDEDRYRRVRVSSSKFNEQVWKLDSCRNFLLKSGWLEVSLQRPGICMHLACPHQHKRTKPVPSPLNHSASLCRVPVGRSVG